VIKFYRLVLRRAIRSTLGYAREDLVRLILGLVLFAIVGQVLTRLIPFVGGANDRAASRLLDDLGANYVADLTVTAGFLLLGGLLVFGWNVVAAPALMYEECRRQLTAAVDAAGKTQAKLERMLKNPEHIAQLRQALRLVPNGRLRTDTELYDALREHLLDSVIWIEQERLRELMDRDVSGRQAVKERLTLELIHATLPPQAGAHALALLSERARRALDGDNAPFPNQPWWIDKGRWLSLGPDYMVAEVHTFDEVIQVVNDFCRIWDDIPMWKQVHQVTKAQRDLPALRQALTSLIENLLGQSDFPGLCHLCMPRA
jgi:hypothetical protein